MNADTARTAADTAADTAAEVEPLSNPVTLPVGASTSFPTNIAPHPTYMNIENLDASLTGTIALKIGAMGEEVSIGAGKIVKIKRFWGGVVAYASNSGSATLKVWTA